ncbi:HNH endonuclease [Dermabacteraceae bacterium P13138]
MADKADGSRYRRLRQTFRTTCHQNDTPCWLCHQPIDYTLTHPDPEAFELDHLYPRSTHPQHTHDPANFRASHKRCNAARGNQMPTDDIGTPSRKWFTT